VRPEQRVDALARFRTIEAGLVTSSQNITGREVANMSQWSRLRQELDALWSAIGNLGERDTWAFVLTKLDQVETMIENARYRLDPSIANNRVRALIPEGTNARLVYENQLEEAEASLRRARLRIAQSPELDPDAATSSIANPAFVALLQADTADTLPVLTTEPMVLDFGTDLTRLDGMPSFLGFGVGPEESDAIRHARDAVNVFETALGRTRLPDTFTSEALHASSTTIARYRTYIDEHSEYRQQLAELEAKERTARALLNEARHTLGPDFDRNGWSGSSFLLIERRFRGYVDERKVVRTLLYTSELSGRQSAAAQTGLDYFARIFHVSGSPLSPDEELALERDHDANLRRGPVSIGDRLELLEELRIPTNPNQPIATLGLYVTRAGEKGLVGIKRSMGDALVEVIALDAHAEALLGGRTPQIISRASFTALSLDEITGCLASSAP
jgi:hypothetical protein